MTRLVLSVSDPQLKELGSRLLPASSEFARIETQKLSNEETYVDRSGHVDAFVLRAVGTLLQLLEHQGRGGRVLLDYGDGQLAQLRLNAEEDGVGIPPTNPAKEPPFNPRTTRGRE